MAGWYYRLDGHEFEWTLGVGDGQGGLACCDSWGLKESDTTEWLNWTAQILSAFFNTYWCMSSRQEDKVTFKILSTRWFFTFDKGLEVFPQILFSGWVAVTNKSRLVSTVLIWRQSGGLCFCTKLLDQPMRHLSSPPLFSFYITSSGRSVSPGRIRK